MTKRLVIAMTALVALVAIALALLVLALGDPRRAGASAAGRSLVVLVDGSASMKGTSSHTPRCAALSGNLGERVSCTIYENRPSPCREYNVFLEDGSLNPRCNQARAKHGFEPLNVRYLKPAN